MSVDKETLSVVNKLLAQRESAKAKEKELIEKQEEWKLVVNRLAATADGEYFFQVMVKYSKLFQVDNEYNPAILLEDKAKREFYLKHMRPYLDKKLKSKIE